MQDSGRKMDLVYTTELMLNMHYKELQPDVNDNEIDSNKKSNETVPNKECNEIDSDTKYNKTEPGKASPNDESRNRRKKRLKNKKAQRKKEEKICKGIVCIVLLILGTSYPVWGSKICHIALREASHW